MKNSTLLSPISRFFWISRMNLLCSCLTCASSLVSFSVNCLRRVCFVSLRTFWHHYCSSPPSRTQVFHFLQLYAWLSSTMASFLSWALFLHFSQLSHFTFLILLNTALFCLFLFFAHCLVFAANCSFLLKILLFH